MQPNDFEMQYVKHSMTYRMIPVVQWLIRMACDGGRPNVIRIYCTTTSLTRMKSMYTPLRMNDAALATGNVG